MATKCTKPVVRETSFIDYRTNQPILIQLEPKLIRLWAKKSRTKYTVPIEQLWILGGRNELAKSQP